MGLVREIMSTHETIIASAEQPCRAICMRARRQEEEKSMQARYSTAVDLDARLRRMLPVRCRPGCLIDVHVRRIKLYARKIGCPSAINE